MNAPVSERPTVVDIHALQIDSRRLDGAEREDAKADRRLTRDMRRSRVEAHRTQLHEQADALDKAGFIENITRSLGTAIPVASTIGSVVGFALAGPLPAATVLGMTWGSIPFAASTSYAISWAAGKGFAAGSRAGAIDHEASAKAEMVYADRQSARIESLDERISDQSSRADRKEGFAMEVARLSAQLASGQASGGAGGTDAVQSLAKAQWRNAQQLRRDGRAERAESADEKREVALRRVEQERVEQRQVLKAKTWGEVTGGITKAIEYVGMALAPVTYGASSVVAQVVNAGVDRISHEAAISPANEAAKEARTAGGHLRTYERSMAQRDEDRGAELESAQRDARRAEKMMQIASEFAKA